MIDLSIVIPSIRTQNWKNLIASIVSSCTKYQYEIIFVGPYYNDYIDNFPNIKYVKDLGSPNRCQQLGSLVCDGKYIHFGSDDCMYRKDSLDNVIDILCPDKVITCNYSEGGNSQITMSLIKAYSNNIYGEIQEDWVYFNVPFMKTDLFKQYNFNCLYQTTCWGHTDLAARIQDKISRHQIEVYDDPIFDCTHMPNITGDHAPIHHAFFEDSRAFYSTSIKSKPRLFTESSIKWSKRFD